jgi:putative ABC transport system substrate-binding protein
VHRHAFIAGTLALLGTPLAVKAQPAGRVARVGWLWSGRSVGDPSEVAGFRRGLGERGYIEGQTIVVEYRFGEGRFEPLPDLATELVRLKVDVIVTIGSHATRAARQATTLIPIVATTGDPVASGFVTSLARPGGNITGFSLMLTQGTPGLREKWIDLLKETVPGASRLGYLWNPTLGASNFAERQRAALALRINLHSFPVQRLEELDEAFAAMTRERVGGVVVDAGHPMIADWARVAALAVKHRIPAITEQPEFAKAGGLLSYGANIFDVARRMAHYVDRILKGAKPADLPVEQPTKFEFVINLRTAKALGLTIPPAVLARADEVIQ